MLPNSWLHWISVYFNHWKIMQLYLYFHLRFQGCMYHTDKSFSPKAQDFDYTMADRYFKSWMSVEFYLILLDIYWDGYTVLNC